MARGGRVISNKENTEEMAIAYYDGLSPKDQAALVRSLMDNLEDHQSKAIASHYVKCPATEEDTVRNISFDNCNKVAKALVIRSPFIANGLYQELKYWAENGEFENV